MLKNISKNNFSGILILILISVIFFTANFNASCKLVYQGKHHYKGTDGKWHWVEIYKDSVSGEVLSKDWVYPNKTPNWYSGRKHPHYYGNSTPSLKGDR